VVDQHRRGAAYLATVTGSDAVGAFLVDTGGRDAGGVAGRIQALLGSSATVTDVGTVRGQVGSSLTAVDLAGLTCIESGSRWSWLPRAVGWCSPWGWPSAAAVSPSPSRSVPADAICTDSPRVRR
jgi:hypothetical protein